MSVMPGTNILMQAKTNVSNAWEDHGPLHINEHLAVRILRHFYEM